MIKVSTSALKQIKLIKSHVPHLDGLARTCLYKNILALLKCAGRRVRVKSNQVILMRCNPYHLLPGVTPPDSNQTRPIKRTPSSEETASDRFSLCKNRNPHQQLDFWSRTNQPPTSINTCRAFWIHQCWSFIHEKRGNLEHLAFRNFPISCLRQFFSQVSLILGRGDFFFLLF